MTFLLDGIFGGLGLQPHHRICSKSYSKDSGMIPRLDVAVERRAFGARFGGPPWWVNMPLEQITERLRGTIPDTYGAAELRAQGETLHDKLRGYAES
jgi:hypothetical protein